MSSQVSQCINGECLNVDVALMQSARGKIVIPGYIAEDVCI